MFSATEGKGFFSPLISEGHASNLQQRPARSNHHGRILRQKNCPVSHFFRCLHSTWYVSLLPCQDPLTKLVMFQKLWELCPDEDNDWSTPSISTLRFGKFPSTLELFVLFDWIRESSALSVDSKPIKCIPHKRLQQNHFRSSYSTPLPDWNRKIRWNG